MPADPLDRFHELVDDARREIASVSSDHSGRTPGASAEAVERLGLAEGRVLGYLEALSVVRPDLARLAVDVAEKLTAEVGALRLTLARGDGEPFPEED
ncbi:MAG: hypothetical protein E6J02_08495 [Chloroflexi bacterium]|nr:MAG: hypothetical protein E6J02_08495 [Chloroflexota bacterium]TME15916.1 MAG: hypothetical protein E6I63_07985 [Chloroflexota bacterium]TME18725.1 MAG: hypothetical protein E6I70_06635 [Chloroflexota bacterium]